MAVKLDRLERAGLIVQERHQRMTLLFLTRDGREAADMIERIRRVIGDGEVRGDPARISLQIPLRGVFI